MFLQSWLCGKLLHILKHFTGQPGENFLVFFMAWDWHFSCAPSWCPLLPASFRLFYLYVEQHGGNTWSQNYFIYMYIILFSPKHKSIYVSYLNFSIVLCNCMWSINFLCLHYVWFLLLVKVGWSYYLIFGLLNFDNLSNSSPLPLYTLLQPLCLSLHWCQGGYHGSLPGGTA